MTYHRAGGTKLTCTIPRTVPSASACIRDDGDTSGRRTRPPDRIAVVGFGYVALPVVHAFARRFAGTMGFDVSGTKYSPERINPGDTRHKAQRMAKVVASEEEASLERVTDVRSAIVDVGVRRAHSIRVAEAARAIENTKAALDTDGLPIGLEYRGL